MNNMKAELLNIMIISRTTTKKTFMLGSLIYLSLAPHAFGSMIQKDDAQEKRPLKRPLAVVQSHADQETPIKAAHTQKSSSPHQGSVASRKGTTSLSTKAARFFESLDKTESREASNKKAIARPSTPAKIKNSKKIDQAQTNVEIMDMLEHLEQRSLHIQSSLTPKKRTSPISSKAVKFFDDQQAHDNSKKKIPLKLYYTMNGAEIDDYFLDSDQVTFMSKPDEEGHDTAVINFEGNNISVTWTQAHSNHDAQIDLRFASSGFSRMVTPNLILGSRSFTDDAGIFGHPITDFLTLKANHFSFNETLFLFNKNAFLKAADSPSVIRELALTKKAGARSVLLKGAIDFSRKDGNFEGSGFSISGIQELNITLDKTLF